MDLLDHVRATGLLDPSVPAVVLLSGGRDSVCLLDVAVLLGVGVTALHVNYGLREEAAEDEASCARLCERLGVALEVELTARPAPPQGNLHAWARDVRYAAAARLAGSRAVVATAHTASDQAETVLYRLATSPGRRALLGMVPRSGRLVRPLLGVGRQATGDWCASRGLAWRDDRSNDDPAFARARTRHGLLPALTLLDARAEANVVRTAQALREEAEVLDVVVATALGGRDEIAVEHLASLPAALARLVLRRLAEGATGGLCGRAPGRLAEVLALGTGALDLGDGARAEVRGGVLRVISTPPLA